METSKLKPDLMAASSRSAQDKRILAHLEHGARLPSSPARASGWSIDGWTIGLFALLLLMCSVAWMMHDKRITPQTFRRERSYAPAPVRTTIPSTEAVGQAATIINDTPPPQPEAPTPTAATVAAANAARSVPAPARAAAVQRKPAATAAPDVAPPPNGDTDVTLLTALVAHAGKPASVTPERPRDIVERQEGDTTAQLLARCKQLGLIEGMLCRSRICSGRWEADAACRAPSH